MAKKFGKFLLFTAAASAAGAAAYYYLRKKDTNFLDETDEDYDDFSEDIEDESPSRTYVPLNHDDIAVPDSDSPKPESVQESAVNDNDEFTPLTEQVSQATENIINTVEESVEEFFDEDTDGSAEESAEESVEESTEEFFDDEN